MKWKPVVYEAKQGGYVCSVEYHPETPPNWSWVIWPERIVSGTKQGGHGRKPTLRGAQLAASSRLTEILASKPAARRGDKEAL